MENLTFRGAALIVMFALLIGFALSGCSFIENYQRGQAIGNVETLNEIKDIIQ